MKIPRHVAIIPDGNRRWAKMHNLPTFEGHRHGFEMAVKIGKKARDLGIPIMTFWGFSTENWKRSPEEVDKLMFFFGKMIDRFIKDAVVDKIRIIHLGRKDRLSKTLLSKIENAEKKTVKYKQYYLVLALDYGGQDEIIRALKHMIGDKVASSKINEKLINSYLDTKNIPFPYPDLIIRTSGEKRLSGYLLWQSAYAELMFVDNFFPDFTPDLFVKCIDDFGSRNRNFGA